MIDTKLTSAFFGACKASCSLKPRRFKTVFCKANQDKLGSPGSFIGMR